MLCVAFKSGKASISFRSRSFVAAVVIVVVVVPFIVAVLFANHVRISNVSMQEWTPPKHITVTKLITLGTEEMAARKEMGL